MMLKLRIRQFCLFIMFFGMLSNISIIDLFAANNHELLIRSGKFIPQKNLNDFLINQRVAGNELFGNSYFRLIQFENIPTDQQKKELADNGIRLISYMPNYAFMAQINVSSNLRSLENSGVRSVLTIDPVWKLSNSLNNAEYPEHALINEKEIILIVKYYKGLSADAVSASLLQNGFQIRKRYDFGNWIEISSSINEISLLASLPCVANVEPIAPPSEPDDFRGRSLHRSNTINTDMPMGRHYSGTGVSAALADDGAVGPHIDYTGRIDQSNVSSPGLGGSHGDMTSGILMGAGNLDPTIQGMGSGAFIYIYDIGGYNHILNSPVTNQTLGVLVTSTSYSQGCNEYTTDTQTGDQILHDNPTLLHVYSAGNSAASNCNYGAGAGWGNITGGYKQGKNVIACANLDYKGVRTTSSSRGPAHDGRVKPDISANGTNQLSTDQNNTYQVGGGTSAACPGIAGIVTQLQQAYRDLNSGMTADGALIKACMLNTAEDLGNPGPDYSFGYGRVNAYRAALTLEENRYLSDSVTQGSSNQHSIIVPPNTAQVRIMIHWTDVEGDPLALKALVNDINMTVTDPSSMIYDPWVLNPTPTVAAITSPATRGVDDLNNSEQVTLDNPVAGTYVVDVDGFLIPQGPQKYYLVVEFVTDDIEVTYPIGGEGFVPGETETIRWDYFDTSGSFTLEYSTDGGTSWNLIANNVTGTQDYYDWTVPSVLTGQAKVRVTKGTASGESMENFTIIGLPTNIQVAWACPDSIKLEWTGVTGALGYEVSMLGNMYMDSVGYTTNTDFVIPNTNPVQEYWFSVKAYAPNGNKGRRANAIQKAPGVFSCPVAIDASLAQVNSPAAGVLQDCMDLSSIEVSIELENKGQNPLTNVPVNYSVNNNPTVSETYVGTLAVGASANHIFATNINLQVAGTYNIKIWAAYPADGNTYNDTIEVVVEVISGTLQTLPYTENFETFSLCSSASNCEQEVCLLSNGWINEVNGTADDIDWRTSEGSTPSIDTGPDQDHNPGTTSGNYLYTEASVCFNKSSLLISPCLDLTTATAPQFEFWYHMYGAAMGTLHVDVLYNDVWQLDVIAPISGDQGNQWLQSTLNLSPYVGGIINIRFRAQTGPNFTSDIAIDDISVYEVQAPPIPGFYATNTDLCVGQATTLMDQSQNSPNTWAWTLNPATGYTYINGTSNTSQNPELTFSVSGVYDVTLSVTNGFGNSSTTINSYIVVGQSASIPLVETFQAANFPPVNWNIENTDAGTTWVQRTAIPGSGGANTNAAWMNNFAYNSPGQEDGLITEKLDLTSAISPILTFDVAYAPYSATFWDGLRVDISTDCGLTFSPTGYYKENTVLATVATQTTNWTPTGINDWRNDTIDLSAWNGNVVIFKFVNINGFGNSLFLDNINFDETSTGLSDSPEYLPIEVYPNPGKGLFNISLPNLDGKEADLKVIDLSGRVIYQSKIESLNNNKVFSIDLSSKAEGVYFIEINNKSQLFTGKVSVIK